ncbi:hypothetical protein [Nocardioides sp.]|uniref:hypothetical protein n=1 Tax=Nocardioides sp. TaxID=35761 RepID=UPI0019C146A2|nr:hypothetical protein [Nocardioides sp.]MBC7279197.1 hypothetical protein [Nocardioides sp.]
MTWLGDGPKGGRVLLRCQLSSPCSTGDIVAAIGLTMSDLFDTPPFRGSGVAKPMAKRPAKPVASGEVRHMASGDDGEPGGEPRQVAKAMAKPVASGGAGGGGEARLELVATYPYTDAEGTILYDIRRWRGGVAKYSARSFDKNGRPRKGMPAPARRVLYRLPEVLAADVVYLNEGEKDADSTAEALQEAAEGSAAATSAPFGAADTEGRAKAVWLPQFTESLRGKLVRIVVDRDRAGYAHGLHVHDAVVDVAAAVELLEPAEGNDATNHLEAGRTLAELVPLTREDLVAKLAEFATATPAGETGGGETGGDGEADGDPAEVANPVAKQVATSGEMAKGSPAVGETDGGADGETGAEDGEAAKVYEFPRQPPAGRAGVPVFEERAGRLYEVRWKKDKSDRWVEDLVEVLGCDVQMVTQVLGGLVGDEEADKAAASKLERFELVARHPETGEELLLSVEAKEWRNGDWLESLWPDVEYSTTRDGRAKIARAVRQRSKNVTRIAEHKATGWRDLPGLGRAFVHAGGAITATGLVPTPTRFVGPPKNYYLPAPPTSPAELEAAAAHSIGLLTDDELLPRMGLVLAGAAYRACLGYSEFVPVFVGNPGSGKTAFSIVLVQHFSGSRIKKSREANVQMDPEHGGTPKFGMKLLNRAADVVIAYDDFAPDKSPLEAASRMGSFIRAAFNGAGRPKLDRTGDPIEGEPPRGMALLTAEMLPSVTSARERMLNVPSQWAKVDLANKHTLMRLQSAEAADGRAAFLSAVIQWAARRDPIKLTESLERWQLLAADRLAGLGFVTRTSNHVSRLYAGWRVAAQVMIDGGVWTEAEGKEFVASKVWPACIEAAHADSDADEERDPGRLFLRLLGESLIGQDGHVVDDAGKVPEGLEPTACGWRPGLADDVFLPSGVRIGYVRPNPRTGELRLLLLPKAAAAVAAKSAEQAGLKLGLTVPGISQALAAAGVGLLTTTEGNKTQLMARRRIAGILERVWDLPLSAVWGSGEETPYGDEDGGNDGPPDGGGDAPAPTTSPGGVVAKLEAPAACAGCGEPASHTLDGVPLHLGECDAPGTAPAVAVSNVLPLPSAGEDVPAAPLEDDPLPLPEETPPAAPAEVPSSAPAATATPAPRAPGARRAARAAALDIDPAEVSEAQTWAASVGEELTEDQAADVVRRFHEVTGCRWKGSHGTIRALLDGHTKWPGAKAPASADLDLFEDLRRTDAFWKARTWITTPGDPAESSTVKAADVNAQYVASAASVELGEGDPLHYEPADELPENLYKLPGWIRLGADVVDAPHNLELLADMWVPMPLAVYLTRDHGRELEVSEALVWPKHRRALKNLANHFGRWSAELKADESPAGGYALRMVKSLYTKSLGGYLASEKGLTPPAWHRPDWALLLKAQAEANMLRNLDKLPAGCIPRAKYADTVFVEITADADLTTWPSLDPVQPGRFKLVPEDTPPVPALSFRGLKATADAWRVAYEAVHVPAGAAELEGAQA